MLNLNIYHSKWNGLSSIVSLNYIQSAVIVESSDWLLLFNDGPMSESSAQVGGTFISREVSHRNDVVGRRVLCRE